MIFQKFSESFSLAGEEVSLEQLLEAREKRAALQRRCLEKYGQTVLSLTLLAVGGVKKNALSDYVFAKSLENLTACFIRLGVSPTAKFIRPLETGHEALFVLPVDAQRLKKAMIELEESSPLARLWDLDVISAEGRLLSRSEFGFPPRACLICAENAKYCARSRKHALEDIQAEIVRRVQAVGFAEKIANSVYRALLQEARLTPKPGLVDSANNGAHQDMNLQTFERSAEALRPFFAEFVLKGIETAGQPEREILAQIRPLGLAAEQAMFAATDGVNSHKGAIFTFGLICTAIGRLFANRATTVTYDEAVRSVCETAGAFCCGLTAELQNYPENQPLTAGVKIYRAYGLTGARGEAEAGFPLVRKTVALALKEPHGENAGLIRLLFLMAHNQDTNVVSRGGPEGLRFVQSEARKRLENAKILQNPTALIESLQAFDQACIERNLSSGGSADLLALTFFFLSLK